MSANSGIRRVKITRWGCEDVRGAHVVWDIGGRHYIGEVMDISRNETRGVWLLHCRHMDGSPTPDVAASYVKLLEREYEFCD